LLFIDLETCCRGLLSSTLPMCPKITERYSGADQELLRDCQILALAMVAAWRYEFGGQLPNSERVRRELLSALHDGPPFPAIDVVCAGQIVRRIRRPPRSQG